MDVWVGEGVLLNGSRQSSRDPISPHCMPNGQEPLSRLIFTQCHTARYRLYTTYTVSPYISAVYIYVCIFTKRVFLTCFFSQRIYNTFAFHAGRISFNSTNASAKSYWKSNSNSIISPHVYIICARTNAPHISNYNNSDFPWKS